MGFDRLPVRVGVAVLLLSAGCGKGWETVYSAASADGKARLLVRDRNCLNDCAIEFAHAAWSGTVASILADLTWCSTVMVAYDTATGKAVEFESTVDWLKEDIAASYRTSEWELNQHGGNAFSWAIRRSDGKWRSLS